MRIAYYFKTTKELKYYSANNAITTIKCRLLEAYILTHKSIKQTLFII